MVVLILGYALISQAKIYIVLFNLAKCLTFKLNTKLGLLLCTNHIFILCFYIVKTGDLKSTQNWKRFLFSKKFKNFVYFSTCILPGYMAHEITKEMWKNSHLKNMSASSLLRGKNILQYFTPEMMHFQAWKKLVFTNISL